MCSLTFCTKGVLAKMIYYLIISASLNSTKLRKGTLVYIVSLFGAGCHRALKFSGKNYIFPLYLCIIIGSPTLCTNLSSLASYCFLWWLKEAVTKLEGHLGCNDFNGSAEIISRILYLSTFHSDSTFILLAPYFSFFVCLHCVQYFIGHPVTL